VTAGQWADYRALLESLTRTLEDLTAVEQQKTAAVSCGDLEAVDACMKREQVLSLSLRGADQKREKLVRQMGLSEVPLRDLLGHCPQEEYFATQDVVVKLQGQYKIFQAASQVARDTLECHLRAIEKIQKDYNGGEPLPEQPLRQSDFLA